jgi:hypothetical protein
MKKLNFDNIPNKLNELLTSSESTSSKRSMFKIDKSNKVQCGSGSNLTELTCQTLSRTNSFKLRLHL